MDSMTDIALQATPDFAPKLLNWFDQHGRKDLPWQTKKSPYRVWVSEIMLQQTQVSAVIGYYQNFMARFPDLETLAAADTDSVLQHWAGLGYYARARNLHKCARIIASEFGGVFPDTLEQLVELPGIGRSTAGAILSIAFQQPAPILDGNVRRVLCRLYAVDSWPGKPATEKALWQLAGQLTPEQRVDEYTQAIMDLGATLCSRSRPQCHRCPFQSDCLSFKRDLQTSIPVPKPRKTIPTKAVWVARIENPDGALLLEKRPEKGIWGGLYSLPEFDPEMDKEGVVEAASRKFGITSGAVESLPEFQHIFSHYKLRIQPLAIKLGKNEFSVSEASHFEWYMPQEVSRLGLPAPIKKFLSQQPERQSQLELYPVQKNTDTTTDRTAQ